MIVYVKIHFMQTYYRYAEEARLRDLLCPCIKTVSVERSQLCEWGGGESAEGRGTELAERPECLECTRNPAWLVSRSRWVFPKLLHPSGFVPRPAFRLVTFAPFSQARSLPCPCRRLPFLWLFLPRHLCFLAMCRLRCFFAVSPSVGLHHVSA